MNACVNACVFGSAKCASECTLCVSVFVWDVCVYIMYMAVFVHDTLLCTRHTSCFADSTLLHTMHCVLYKREFVI